ncbi:MAG: hypothetical protein JWQ71_1710 [Pedosphaera sp.]|nr:hypothetical protein [Pedosphaera sp.]
MTRFRVRPSLHEDGKLLLLGMNVDKIKAEMAVLPQEQQDHLAAYLVHLRHQRDTGVHQEITSRIDDIIPDHWVSLDELKKNGKTKPCRHFL